jgi:hypothetical protein
VIHSVARQGESVLREIQSRIKKPYWKDLCDTVLARIKSGKLTEDMELTSVLDSLDTVQLMTEIEKLGVEATVPIRSVGDLLWLFKAIDLKHEKQHKRPRQAI